MHIFAIQRVNELKSSTNTYMYNTDMNTRYMDKKNLMRAN